jgi:phytoene dehydrogenase-like protein
VIPFSLILLIIPLPVDNRKVRNFLHENGVPSMKWQDDEYEVIVLGSGLGGLIAGTRLSKEHRRVLLLREKPYQPFREEKGYRFVPFSNFSEKRIKAALLKRISKELELPLFIGDGGETGRSEIRGKKANQRAAFQVILPRARIDLFRQGSMFQRELKREFPRQMAEIENFYNEMEGLRPLLEGEREKEGAGSVFPVQPRALIKRFLALKVLPKGEIDSRLAPFSREFREFIRLQLFSWGNLFEDRFPASLAAYLLSDNERDEWQSGMDLERLREKILEKFFQTGGKIEEIQGVEKIERRWRKGITLSIRGEERAIRSRFVIFNFPLRHISDMLGEKRRRLSKWDGRILPRFALIPLFLGIREKAVPVGMGDLLASILDLNKPYEGGNLLFISLGQKGDESEAPEGRRSLTVESLMTPERWDPDSFVEHQQGVLKHLSHLFPFLEENIEFTDWDWVYGQYSCWSYPHFLYETSSDFQWREGVFPNRISKNLYFIGKENFPYLGMEGEVLGGLIVARKILEQYS